MLQKAGRGLRLRDDEASGPRIAHSDGVTYLESHQHTTHQDDVHKFVFIGPFFACRLVFGFPEAADSLQCNGIVRRCRATR